MTIYKNARYTERQYECTNVVACEAAGPPPTDAWVPMDPRDGERLLERLTMLHRIGDVRYYGYL